MPCHPIRSAFVVCCVVFSLAVSVRAADWPNPTGPHANSTVPEDRLREDLQANPPRVAWKFPLLFRGYGAPVIDKGTIYILDRDPNTMEGARPNTNDDQFQGAKELQWASQPDRKTYLRSIDLNTGKENWSSSWIDEGSCRYDGIRSWPVFDDNRIFLIDHGGVLRCFDKATRREVWKSTFGRKATGRGMDSYTKSPVLYRDTVIVTRTDWQDWAKGKSTNTVIALDTATGAERWSIGVPGCYSCMGTPALITLGGVDQIVIHGDRYVQVDERPGPARSSAWMPVPAASSGALMRVPPPRRPTSSRWSWPPIASWLATPAASRAVA